MATKTIPIPHISAVAMAVGELQALAGTNRGKPIRWSDLSLKVELIMCAWDRLAKSLGVCGVDVDAKAKESLLPVGERELDTILAALRAWQLHGPHRESLEEIASEHGRPLSKKEIDALCERLNCA